MLPEPLEKGERLQRFARTMFVIHARAYVVVNAFLVALWFILGANGIFWPGIVIVSWGVAVVLQGMFTFARPSNNG